MNEMELQSERERKMEPQKNMEQSAGWKRYWQHRMLQRMQRKRCGESRLGDIRCEAAYPYEAEKTEEQEEGLILEWKTKNEYPPAPRRRKGSLRVKAGRAECGTRPDLRHGEEAKETEIKAGEAAAMREEVHRKDPEDQSDRILFVRML